MVAKNIRTQLNYNSKVKNSERHEICIGQSLTEQSASISPREIMYRFTSGNLPEIQKDHIEEQEPLTFEDYQNYHDMEYELSDLTRDRIRIQELKQEVEISLKAKEDLRKKRNQKELAEILNYKKLLEEAKEKEKLNKTPDL